MITKEQTFTVTATSPSSATTAVAASTFPSGLLTKSEGLLINATITGGTGGSIDVYLQYKTGTNAWVDWVHFPQVAAATTKRYSVQLPNGGDVGIVEVGGGSDAAPGVALAAGKALALVPPGEVRVVFVAGASTSAGATQTISITCYTEKF